MPSRARGEDPDWGGNEHHTVPRLMTPSLLLWSQGCYSSPHAHPKPVVPEDGFNQFCQCRIIGSLPIHSCTIATGQHRDHPEFAKLALCMRMLWRLCSRRKGVQECSRQATKSHCTTPARDPRIWLVHKAPRQLGWLRTRIRALVGRSLSPGPFVNGHCAWQPVLK